MTIPTVMLQMHRLHPSFGVGSSGVDLCQPLDDGTWAHICLLHRGRPWNAKQYTRVMHRTTVAGDGPTA